MEHFQVAEPEPKRSFSFSCYNDEGTNSDIDDESYIEIELEPISTRLGREGNDNAEVAEEELELRISFSSKVPSPEFSIDERTEKVARSPFFSSSASELSFSSEETTNSWSAPMAMKPCKMQRTIKRRVQLSAVSRLLDTFLSSSRTFSEIGDKPGHPVDAKELPIQSNCWESVQCRKGSNTSITKRRQGRMMMKFWMKLRSKNIGALLESLLKRPQLVSASNRKNRGAEGFDKCLVQKERGMSSRRKDGKMFWNGNHSGVFEANLGTSRVGERRSKSCPGSRKTSPLHPWDTKTFAGECSVQAAIAHCKRSYGQSSDFRF